MRTQNTNLLQASTLHCRLPQLRIRYHLLRCVKNDTKSQSNSTGQAAHREKGNRWCFRLRPFLRLLQRCCWDSPAFCIHLQCKPESEVSSCTQMWGVSLTGQMCGWDHTGLMWGMGSYWADVQIGSLDRCAAGCLERDAVCSRCVELVCMLVWPAVPLMRSPLPVTFTCEKQHRSWQVFN